jgi:hypothetical protein
VENISGGAELRLCSPPMLGTYACFLLVLGAAALVGQAILIACGRREWSRLAPAVGLAALCPLAWWTVRLPGEASAAMVAIGLVVVLAGTYAFGRVAGLRSALRRGIPIELAAVALASLPFIVEWRFGILGTSLNPDMSQHLLAVDRLAVGAGNRLITDGYPLGPHSIVAALSALGPSTVQAFDGLTLAVAVAACLAPLALLEELSAWRRAVGALCIGFAYLVAAYLVQGAFKETIQALFVIAFAIGLGELARGWSSRPGGAPRPLRGLPLAVLAIGSVYTYSFPGLLWLGGAFAVWALIELARARRRSGVAEVRLLTRLAAPTVLAAFALLALAIAPELGRIVDFAGFETFDPAGAGLGNLFDRLSPLEALGIWPSGDFRVEPGDGTIPAIVFYLGAAIAAAALAHGLRWWWRRGDRAVPAALGAAVLLWLYALLAGTPYQEAKALVLAAPLVILISIRAIAERAPDLAEARRILRRRSIALVPGRARDAKERLVVGVLGIVFVPAALASSLLALANGPVGPSGYSPALVELRDELPVGSTLVVAPDELLDDQHGADWIAWELRGNRICIESESESAASPPAGVIATLSVSVNEDGAVVPDGIQVNRTPTSALGPCPLIPDAARADPGAGG